MDEEAIAAGNIDVTNLKVRSRNWIYARSTESSSGNLKFDKPETQEAVSMILKYAENKKSVICLCGSAVGWARQCHVLQRLSTV